MKVRFSSGARAYVNRETKYLKERSASGAESFRRVVGRAVLLLADFPQSGVPDSIVRLTGARRTIIGGYLFDYDLIDGTVWILNVRHSTNTPAIEIEDDPDYSPER